MLADEELGGHGIMYEIDGELKTREERAEEGWRGRVGIMKKLRNALTLHITTHGRKYKVKREGSTSQMFGDFPEADKTTGNIVIGKRMACI